ncbi:tumor necrosis factor alpha-induced protein 2a isoform X1 [Chiloscyllium plagiosum]|uniref:tumor necrosis factor alpha-induced protein 2a isoform X1 n=2 Tax=Chiloscyllium plagiosum TaxID=36176 RepID=UPI001CB832A0|nr:tumor necrosis factor alpha-induced protein 2a isoform X1 [Chiloscyllium plagiosum]XP_043553413.1 tumor necrosis factor alpha-induced protein 2a isoform X1 [Chiloscyllium plagiosum]XP_043553414.1 tumor necrosis factor alpha-induced protein 2a isoform X1 [Chiloscyllium plagiosum]
MKKFKRLFDTSRFARTTIIEDVGNKVTTRKDLKPQKADPSGKSPKRSTTKKYNLLTACCSVPSHNMTSNSEEHLDSTDNIMDILEINGHLWHSITLLQEKDIKELIEQQRYFKADQHLIKLEYERYTNDVANDESTKKEEKAINSLYELLSAEIFNVVKESFNISKEHPNLLKMAVQVKIQEEKADQIYLEEKEKSGSVPEFRPRQWDAKWLSILQHSVNERISEPLSGSEDSKTDWLTQCLVQLRSQLKADFDTIVNCINPCYPEEYNICVKYAECYCKTVSSHISLLAESGLKGKEVYPLLYWINKCYPDIMIAVIPSEDTRQQLLNTLLPEKIINHLKNEYFSVLRSDARMCMIKSLHIEEENWRSGKEPLVLNDCYHSELPIDIIQIIDGAVKDARTLTCELGDQALNIMLEETNYFLKSFQMSAENFEKSHLNHPNFISVVISIINSCESIRNHNTNEKITNLVLKESIHSVLNEMEKKKKDIILKTLFCKLKPHCKKLVTEKWLECTEPIDEILEITEKHLTKLKKLKAPHYQDLLMEIHQQLITEYILRIMKKKLSCKTENQEKQVADQIQNESQHLQKLFNFYGPEDKVLESALLKIAEIIRLKDVDAIIIEVAALFRDFPDIRKGHVRAILSMKVSVKRSDEKKILKILNTPMNDSNSSIERKLFSNPTLFKAL